ncbi:GDSL-type esterase/lipase family protein [Subdoligranulum variabile]|uniref:GDSL-type esterase/lipase family protein n=1 Tax=Subdoligranulum variabile TaxID=214851 RepID=UPI00067FAE07|nr:GDSL-type esterase/lipase family protein [Subdoligranulum variabile]UWP68914.1 GDSL-type esterase/lipase family protein [Subdoligranulum variabile]
MPTPQRPGSDRPRRSRMQNEYTWQEGWAHPEPPRPAGGQPGGRVPLTPEQQRALARRRRERRRRRRRTFLVGTVGGILVLSGIITLLLPKSVTGETDIVESAPTGSAQLVAPLPYGGSGGTSDPSTAQTLNWGTVGPVQQSEENGYTYTAVPAAPTALPEFGRVDTSWFADAAFLGDSLTAGFCVNEYNIDVGGALICGYEGISPNSIVNRTTVDNPDRGEEIAMDVLSNAQPAKLYILIGTNALVSTGNDESFLNYYAKMLDDLRTALPNTAFYVQSILAATKEKVEKDAPGLAPDRLATINASLESMCVEKGCYFLDLNAEFRDEEGYLLSDYAQPDGVHLTVSGYNKWVSYLCTHVPYNKNNPYQAGSTYYLSDDIKQLLADIP